MLISKSNWMIREYFIKFEIQYGMINIFFAKVLFKTNKNYHYFITNMNYEIKKHIKMIKYELYIKLISYNN